MRFRRWRTALYARPSIQATQLFDKDPELLLEVCSQGMTSFDPSVASADMTRELRITAFKFQPLKPLQMYKRFLGNEALVDQLQIPRVSMRRSPVSTPCAQ